jgi:cyclic beta-1,2-glucan synthetase
MRNPFRPTAPAPVAEPIHAEVFGVERLEQHAESLASAQPVRRDRGWARRLLSRVADNARVLREAYQVLAAGAREGQPVTPAAEWLIENFHVIDEQLREIRDDLPPGFYRELPKLADGPLAGYPQVYGIAWAFVAHTDSRFDLELLRRFVHAYQRVQVLSIGELWAVAITLRIVLVENVRRVAEEILANRAAREEADRLVDDLLGVGARTSDEAMAELRRHERAPLSTAFSVRMIERLRDQDPAVTPALPWLSARLAAQGTDPDATVQAELQRQAATTVTIRNVITSMRLMSALDWADFFESVSLVDELLRADTNYGAMDFRSRDRYRHAIEKLARRSRHDELSVTREVIAAAQRGASETGDALDDRHGDPGYYLIGDGRRGFERVIGFRPALGQRLLRAYVRSATPGYLGTIVVLTAAILAVPLRLAAGAGAATGSLIALGVLCAIPASELAIALLNRSVTALVSPRVLARLELRDGIPPTLRSIVVVPTLLTTVREVDAQVERLEVYYLANPDGHAHFALLSDWTDAAAQSMPGDAELLAAAHAGIARLNARHGKTPDGGIRFLVLHRLRQWNAAEGCWMGWERKRGKLHELNRLLRGATDTSFTAPDGAAVTAPAGVRYVISLDADTRLPIGAVCRLVGTMAHPLNRPRLDAALGRVVEGYGVLQPRITPPLPVGYSSLYQQVSSGPAGIDPYAAAVSDVYQDLFGEGSYTGKGIYDIDAFESTLADRVPDGALLSHDLFEGIFARAGLVTDIELFEAAPSHYLVGAARQHRWARGDWQLLPWIFRFPTPLIGRWKMLDNLRRTLFAPMAVLTLAVGWLIPDVAPAAWTTLILLIIGLPALLPTLSGILPRARGIAKRSHARGIWRDFRLGLSQIALTVTMLAYQAWLMTDAIVRTLVRLFVTHRHLLEWMPAAQVAAGLRLDRFSFLRMMAGGILVSLVIAVLVAREHPGTWPLALGFVMLWTISPVIAHGVSVPMHLEPIESLQPEDVRSLRLIARRTWEFFVTFVGAEDRYLPPDNYQETPSPVVAHRTSPTNVGLHLLSTLAANDFGWLGTLDTVDQIEATLDAMSGLERLHGHFYNWYDTTDGRPLEPRYLSSVDSGNLAAALIALAGGCQDLLDQSPINRAAFVGIGDTALLVRDTGALDGTALNVPAWRRIHAAISPIVPGDDGYVAGPAEWTRRLASIETAAREVGAVTVGELPPSSEPSRSEGRGWIAALERDIASHVRDRDTLVPWATHSSERTGAGVRELAESWQSLAATPTACIAAAEQLAGVRERLIADGNTEPDVVRQLDAQVAALRDSVAACTALIGRIQRIADRSRALVKAMDFTVLFDPVRKLFSIGLRVTDGTLDSGQYDLLASEARLTSLVAIAKGDVPVTHWFHLGRALTPVGPDSVLISWSGSMFEYLMPALLLQTPEGSLLDQTCRLVVQRQIAYGAERGVPWGISESGYNVRNIQMTYQYSTFGVPGLGLRRQVGEDLVIAPYATGLVAMIDPAAAAENFRELERSGAGGRFGFFEALDYTPSRIPTGSRVAVVRSYMSHHQGMLMLGIADALLQAPMRRRFHAEPTIRACELLLQERTPRDVPVARPQVDDAPSLREVREPALPIARRFLSPHGSVPRAHLLSNGQYAVMVTAAGSGYSRWRDQAVTRWREDPTCDATGAYVFLRDVATGAIWSAAFQPSGAEPDSYSVAFSEDRAEFVRRDGPIATRLEVVVSPEDDAELRRVSLTNFGMRTREIEVTSYAEVVLAPPAADVVHPAFSDLFVRTERIADHAALLATRRPRSANEAEIWLAHVLAVDGDAVGELEWETDRSRFLGRGRGVRRPLAVTDGLPLSNTLGSVLDPVVALRRRIRLRPGGHARLVFSTMVAPTRDRIVALADKYDEASTFERAADLAWTQAQVQLHHLGVTADEAHLFQSLAGAAIFSDRSLRPASDVMTRPNGGRDSLWAHGISGDLPIVLVQVDDLDDVGLVRQLLRAHEYWRMKRLAVDLVILNEHGRSYVQDLQALLETLVRASQPATPSDPHESRGGIFALQADRVPPADYNALMQAARAVLSGRRGTLAEQVVRAHRPQVPVPPQPPPPAVTAPTGTPWAPPNLQMFNGIGGFSADGREYVTVLSGIARTPAPWINVISNPEFGFQVSESGSGHTWSLNSHENQVTGWSNDAVNDPPSEAMYIRDEDSGEVWTATALPIREPDSPYIARHGHGYSWFEHVSHRVAVELLQFVPRQDSIKISRLTLTNQSRQPRRLSVTAVAEWVLGTSRAASAPFIITSIDPSTGAMFARNGWNTDFRERVAFADLGGQQTAWTGDRTEFLGRNGGFDRPAALQRGVPLSGKVGAGADPIGALQAVIALPPGGRATVTFFLGEAATTDEAAALIRRYRGADFDAVLREVVEHWERMLGTVQVRTPEPAMDLMLNRWLLYQTLACRVWARSAFYQASGAYGFRDQLQDVMALAVASGELTRAHLLRAAARQFVDGDVQHWWHPTTGRGLRTRVSDDLLWLPYVATHYVQVTGDTGVLDAPIPFIEGARLAPGELECYFQPRISDQTGTLFEHCARAIDRGLTAGVHGLPLIGTGDWNDGMNRVGVEGKGESIWLGWFLCTVLAAWVPVAEARGDLARATAWRDHRTALAAALEEHGWDGEWYRRAYFDDGMPLGSAINDECRIDAIAQSWSVMSGVASAPRRCQAMVALDQHLIRRDDRIQLLLTPAFDKTALDPGYIKGYLPGIRENGGQYTHAATWSIVALAQLGLGDQAGELFRFLNPITRALTTEDALRYKVEPYVVAGDVYSEAPHAGRGGWTWYTGSAAWLYRAGLESILGFGLRGTRLVVNPCIPRAWPRFTISFRYRSAHYDIAVENPHGVSRGVTELQMDGAPADPGTGIALVDDGKTHTVQVVLGSAK